VTCADCNRPPAHGTVLLEMAPGRDGQPWWLCVEDWLNGARGKDGTVTPPGPRAAVRFPARRSR
jgi:hypothetical protein